MGHFVAVQPNHRADIFHLTILPALLFIFFHTNVHRVSLSRFSYRQGSCTRCSRAAAATAAVSGRSSHAGVQAGRRVVVVVVVAVARVGGGQLRGTHPSSRVPAVHLLGAWARGHGGMANRRSGSGTGADTSTFLTWGSLGGGGLGRSHQRQRNKMH